jgi:hypothetical protein
MKVKEEYCWAITQTKGWSCCGRSGCGVLNCVVQMDSVIDFKEQNYFRTGADKELKVCE